MRCDNFLSLFCLVKEFCCCCKLRTGGFIIAWLCIILTLLPLSYWSNTIKLMIPAEKNEKLSPAAIQVIAQSVGEIFFSFAIFVCSIFLLLGIWKEIPKYLLPWLIVTFVYCFHAGIWIIVDITKGDWLAITQIITICISWYLCCVIYSLYKEMEEEEGDDV